MNKNYYDVYFFGVLSKRWFRINLNRYTYKEAICFARENAISGSVPSSYCVKERGLNRCVFKILVKEDYGLKI